MIIFLKKRKKIDLNNKLSELKISEISNLNDLNKIVEDSDKKLNKGFWLFKEALDKDRKAYGGINKDPWYIRYFSVEYNGKIIGLGSYSLKFDNEYYSPNLHVFDIQTIPGYGGLSRFYFNFFEKIAKQNNKKYITLRCYEDSLQGLYSKFGFVLSDKDYNLMYKKL